MWLSALCITVCTCTLHVPKSCHVVNNKYRNVNLCTLLCTCARATLFLDWLYIKAHPNKITPFYWQTKVIWSIFFFKFSTHPTLPIPFSSHCEQVETFWVPEAYQPWSGWGSCKGITVCASVLVAKTKTMKLSHCGEWREGGWALFANQSIQLVFGFSHQFVWLNGIFLYICRLMNKKSSIFYSQLK